ncbi:MAG: hypothetical protein HY589_00845 [Candidatus Omnitrophica bacterium]|nr:hypothetical protein [Candidatus Omnitrophota bacterium]
MGPAKGIVMLLVSLALGYLVCAKAEEKKGFLKQLGYWIGAIIIIVTLLKGACGISRCLTGGKMPFKCPLTQTCPMMPAK